MGPALVLKGAAEILVWAEPFSKELLLNHCYFR
jgi:hypothetical protein